MEVLYAIISIGLIIILIMSLIFLFRSKSDAKKKRDKNETTIKKLIHGLFFRDKSQENHTKRNSEYQLIYNHIDSVNDTIKEPLLEVTVTDVRYKNIRTTCYIHDDEFIYKNGVSVGRGNCHYTMSSMLMDRNGSFVIKYTDENPVRYSDENFIILGAVKSTNGLRKTYGGKPVKCVNFVDGKATCYVGSIRFDFAFPGADCEKETADIDDEMSGFYSTDTIAIPLD